MNVLLLLVGTNPLPNWVTYRYLAKTEHRPQEVRLIASDQTKPIAARLEQSLRSAASRDDHRDDEVRFVTHVLDDPGNPQLIYRQVAAIVRELPSDADIHLNYTAGTKAMSVHAYRALRDADRPSTKFSYLDATNYRLVFDDGAFWPPASTANPERDLCREVTISLDQLLELHNIDLLDQGAPLHIESAKAIYRQVRFDRGWWGYLDWLRESNIRENANYLRNNVRSSRLPEYPGLATAMRAEWGDVVQEDSLVWRTLPGNHLIEEIVKFLDGGWLEELVYDALGDLNDLNLTRPPITDRRLNVIAKSKWLPSTLGRRESPTMELDIPIIRGYELILISITTARPGKGERRTVKNHAFEAIQRATQLGGDEASAVLVTMMPCAARNGEYGTDDLDADLRVDYGRRRPLTILSRDDLSSDLVSAFKRALEGIRHGE